MYLHLGGGTVVRKRDVVAVCDMDNATCGRDTRALLAAAERAGRLVNAAEDIPRSFVLCAEGGAWTVYLAQPSPAALARRMEEEKLF